MASAQMLSRMLAAKATQGNQGRLYAEDAEEEEEGKFVPLTKGEAKNLFMSAEEE